MKRPVWLFSLDGEGSASAPMTTGGLAAYFLQHGRTRERTEIESRVRLLHTELFHYLLLPALALLALERLMLATRLRRIP